MQSSKPDTSLLSRLRSGDWHAAAPDEAVADLETDSTAGLSGREAGRRLLRYGPNALAATGETAWFTVLARQFTDALILLLAAAAVVAFAVGDFTDGVTICAIIVLNGALGFVQEWKAERSLQALRQLLSPRCRVVRDGRPREIDAAKLVRGDLVLLESGNQVPADLRLVESVNLKVDESALTGESIAVSKGVDAVEASARLAERTCIAWMGTSVTNGRARGIVIATGMASEFGRIAQLTQSIGAEATPLQRKLGSLGKQLGMLAVAVSIVVALVGWLSGRQLAEMLMTGIALAVAVVPEGLPAVVTVTLALGVRAMVRRRALIRRLQATEALGAATVICTDKTGTLTQGEMTVQRVWLPAGDIDVTGVGYEPRGHFEVDARTVDPTSRPDLLALLETGLHCNHATLTEEDSGWREAGEPTEAALVVAAYKAGLQGDERQETVSEFSFNAVRKRMTVIDRHPEGLIAHVKGAPEVVVSLCSRIQNGDDEQPLTDADRQEFERAYTDLAESGLRTLALARRVLPADHSMGERDVECDLTLLGVVGIIDPPRPEVPDAIRLAQAAGIQVIMITGDAAATGLAVARQIGLQAERAVTGDEVSSADDRRLCELLSRNVVFARTTPEHKLRIIRRLKDLGHVVGMTGDGVNDAPALKKADIGIAMGMRGTDVARGASDLILTDDNFASIINAVEEGRRQYDNIQKFVRYLLSSNTGEVVAIFINILLGGPLILLPVQILWMNLVTDGVTAVALGVEPAEAGVMQRPPRSPSAPVVDRSSVLRILGYGTYIGLVTLGLFHLYLAKADPGSAARPQTVAFTAIIVAEKVNVLNFRTLGTPLALVGFFSNRWILVALASTIGLQVAAVYVPFLQGALHTTPLQAVDWALILAAAAPIFIISEAIKTLRWKYG